MRTQNVAAVLAAIAALSISGAQAQLDRPVAPPTLAQPPNSRDCSPSVGNNGLSSNETTGSRALSDQLSQSKGVICPPAGIDPDISVPPIGGGRTPVIPPPGTPGGDPNIRQNDEFRTPGRRLGSARRPRVSLHLTLDGYDQWRIVHRRQSAKSAQ
jgi:hypothetical protein